MFARTFSNRQRKSKTTATPNLSVSGKVIPFKVKILEKSEILEPNNYTLYEINIMIRYYRYKNWVYDFFDKKLDMGRKKLHFLFFLFSGTKSRQLLSPSTMQSSRKLRFQTKPSLQVQQPQTTPNPGNI